VRELTVCLDPGRFSLSLSLSSGWRSAWRARHSAVVGPCIPGTGYRVPSTEYPVPSTR
jgi:hypothetical protein